MTFTYRLQKEQSSWLATCVESDAMGEGKTEQEAVASLRQSIVERMFRPDAVAPPAQEAPHAPIHLELVGQAPPESLDLGGPVG